MKCDNCQRDDYVINIVKLCEGCYKPMKIEIKDTDVLDKILRYYYHDKLIDLIKWIVNKKEEVVITSGKRVGDKGVHGTAPVRGIDIRSYIYTNPAEICTYINRHWSYDPKRPEMKCAIFHDVGKGKHIHLQVHPNTEKV